jgi:hypothetical protein|tara:strand:+ start:1129 stop:1299 length:171 start_codon:yes stop_codon:yes gene_type:complete
MKKARSIDKKHHKLITDYDKQKSKHLEKLASKTLATDEKFRKLQDKKIKGDFLKNF